MESEERKNLHVIQFKKSQGQKEGVVVISRIGVDEELDQKLLQSRCKKLIGPVQTGGASNNEGNRKLGQSKMDIAFYDTYLKKR